MCNKNNDFACTMCGKTDNLDRWSLDRIREIMEEQHVCFKCANWLWQHELDQTDPSRAGRFAVIDGKHYVLAPHTDLNWPRGMAGAKFKIRFNDGREVVCDNLWHQGTVPERFRHLFPDNAEFVREKGFDYIG